MGYEKIWIVGDRFVRESKNIMERMFDVKKQRKEETESYLQDKIPDSLITYLGRQFEVKVFEGVDTLINRSVLGRIRNTLASVLNVDLLLPKYVMLVIDDDILRCVKFNRQGLLMIFGKCIQWLADELHTMIMQVKSWLPVKAKKLRYPQLLWVTLPYHSNFKNNNIRFKFNQGLESVVSKYADMKVLKIRRRWNYSDNSVALTGKLVTDGVVTYWSGID